MSETRREVSLHSLWIAYVVVPPSALSVIIFTWLGFFERDYHAGLMWALAVGAFLFVGFSLMHYHLMGKRFVFHADKLEMFRFRRLLKTVLCTEVEAIFRIGNRDGFMIQTKNGDRLRIIIPSIALQKRFAECLDTFMKETECQQGGREVRSSATRPTAPHR